MRAAALGGVVAAVALTTAVLATRSPHDADEGAPSPAAAAPREKRRPPRRRARATIPPPPPAAPYDVPPLPEKPPDAATAYESRVVRVVTRCSEPVEGLTVWCGTRIQERTGADGRATLRIPAGEVATANVASGRERVAVALRDAETTVVVDPPRLAVEFVDASTGLPVQPAAASCTVRVDWAEGVDHDLAGVRDVLLPLGTGGRACVAVRTRPPAGFGAAPYLSWRRSVAPQARRVRAIVPLWEAAERTLRAVDGEGTPLRGAQVRAVELLTARDAEASRDVTWEGPRSDGAEATLTVARIPANAVWVRVDAVDARGGWSGATVLRDLAAPWTAPVDVTLAPGGPAARSRALSAGSGCRASASGPTTVPLSVRVVRADGAPAPHVRVQVGRDDAVTGADGCVDLAVHDQDVRFAVAAAHGFRATAKRVDLRHVRELTIHEAPAVRARVRVVDDAGAPVPAACVVASALSVAGEHVRDGSYAQLSGDVELLTPRTDAAGCVELEVSDALVRYDVTLAGAAAWADSVGDHVTVVLRAPRP